MIVARKVLNPDYTLIKSVHDRRHYVLFHCSFSGLMWVQVGYGENFDESFILPVPDLKEWETPEGRVKPGVEETVIRHSPWRQSESS